MRTLPHSHHVGSAPPRRRLTPPGPASPLMRTNPDARNLVDGASVTSAPTTSVTSAPTATSATSVTSAPTATSATSVTSAPTATSAEAAAPTAIY